MPSTRFKTYEFQLANQRDFAGMPMIATSGGKFIVTSAGSPQKATLYDPETGLAMSNPVTPTRGKVRFATLDTITSVDVFGFSPDGSFVVRKGLVPGGEPEVLVMVGQAHQCAVIPFHYADYTINAEQDTGLDFPAGVLLTGAAALRVTTADSGITMDWGLLSSESGGDADGILVAASVASTGTVPGLLVGTDTLGALLKEDTNGSSVLVPKPYPIASAVSIVLKFSTGADTAAGYAMIPYLNLVN